MTDMRYREGESAVGIMDKEEAHGILYGFVRVERL